MNDPRPLAVDLDGTLVRSDLLAESYLSFVRRHPLRLLAPFFWLRQGRAAMKSRLASEARVEVDTLPYDPGVLALIDEARATRRPVVLATASDSGLAQQVADHLGRFDRVLASDGQRNLKADHKAALLTDTFGEHQFDYVGNSRADLPVWRSAANAYVANPDPGVLRATAHLQPVPVLVGSPPALAGPLWRSLRPHQWLKNILVFVPLAAAHQVLEPGLLWQGLLAFICFCLCASGVYVLNDLIDLPSDRRHPDKKHRPLASGSLPIWLGALLGPACVTASLVLAILALPPAFSLALAGYLVLTSTYTLWLKRLRILDVLTLALLYTLRVVAGAFATGLEATDWMLGFALLIFLSLALVKRYAELAEARERGDQGRSPGRGYRPRDLPRIAAFGTGAGYLAVVVLALYQHDPATLHLYRHPQWLWLASLLLLFWISRCWVVTRRGDMHEDPVVFAARDPLSLVTGALFCLVFWVAA